MESKLLPNQEPVFKTGHLHVITLIFYLLAMLSLASCTDECETTVTYTTQEPILLKRSDLVQAVKSEPAQALATTGKIYAKDRYVFVNEMYKGIHVIDNSNPAGPKNIAFINIPGNVDMAIRDNILYADAGPDLVALDISDPTQVTVKNHTLNLFPNYTFTGAASNPQASDLLTVGYTTRIVTESRPADCGSSGTGWGGGGFLQNDAGNFMNAANPNKSAGTTGIGGSMARFTITGDYLYAVNPSSIQVVDITQPASPVRGTNVPTNWNTETIFPYQDKLFLGTSSGMLIYDNSQPQQPKFISSISHFFGCDPVVVDGNFAYVTIRNGNECRTGNSINQLEIIDISTIQNPRRIKTYAMQNPHGLGIDRETLFLCEGDYGLKVFNAQNVLKIDENKLAHFKDIHAFDVIPLGNTLLAVGNDGLYQYDYSNPKQIKFLSKIPVTKNH
ncbi:MAG: LVIVD repeat-containing protein [Adhaeribacter sp.]